jgi:hypothetical protein
MSALLPPTVRDVPQPMVFGRLSPLLSTFTLQEVYTVLCRQ